MTWTMTFPGDPWTSAPTPPLQLPPYACLASPWLMALVICEAWKITAQIEADAELDKLKLLIEHIKEQEDDAIPE